ncbi:MAG TPA: MBL fold metallo-hydrolase [Kofleriaceae bacterium]|nr:MBL fold metallo-hydrolase [Kofleriaceae bacterium]
MRFIALAALVAVAGCKKEKSQDEVRTGPGQKGPDKKGEEELPEIQTIEVAPGISMLVGAGGNIAVVTSPRGALVVDDQIPPMRDRVVAAIAKLGGPARLVLNTHWHNDHSGNNEALAGEGAVIVAHENVRKRMSTEQVNAMFDKKTPPSPDAALPVVTFTEEITLHWGGQEIHAIHVAPAHTDGDAIIHFPKGNVIHTGDTYFNGGYPFIDLSTGGSVDGVIAAADRVLALADGSTKIIPGHGPLSNRSELEAYRAMLVAARDRVRALVAKKKSVEDIVAARPTAEWDDRLGKGFVDPPTFIQILVEDAKRAP